jgi:hypothetical protein
VPETRPVVRTCAAPAESGRDRNSDGASLNLIDRCGITLVAHPRVRIDTKSVADLGVALSAKIGTQTPTPYGWDDPKFWPTDADPMIRSQLLAVGNAINFRFWRQSPMGELKSLGGRLEGEYFTGSMYMWRRIRLAHDAKLPVHDAGYLAAADTDTFDELFVDDDGMNPLAEAIDDRVENLRDLGRQLISEWNGQFYNLVSNAGDSLPEFMYQSRRFRAFDDPLAKLTLVNALMHRGSGLTSFRDSLLPAIDYQLLKQLLRQKVLLPDNGLDTKLRQGLYLDSAEAHQLRSAALKALLLVQSDTGLTGDVIDNQLWLNRTVCTDTEPTCEYCSFNSFCAQDIELRRPLQLTRYY